MSKSQFYAQFDQMVWPCPGEAMQSLARKLRYPKLSTKLSAAEMIQAADTIGAYSKLILGTISLRESISRNLKLAAAKLAESAHNAT